MSEHAKENGTELGSTPPDKLRVKGGSPNKFLVFDATGKVVATLMVDYDLAYEVCIYNRGGLNERYIDWNSAIKAVSDAFGAPWEWVE